MVGKELERVVAALLLISGVTSCVMGCVQATPSVPPLVSRGLSGSNVLLVTIDTLRRDRLGAYGNTTGLTPALAKEARP